jgi:hypothetical protein
MEKVEEVFVRKVLDRVRTHENVPPEVFGLAEPIELVHARASKVPPRIHDRILERCIAYFEVDPAFDLWVQIQASLRELALPATELYNRRARLEKSAELA